MGLGYGKGTYPEEVPVAEPEGAEALLRRHFKHLLGLAATSAFGALARVCGGQGRAATRLVAWAEQWLDATCTEDVRAALLSTLSHLNTVTAWCCHDSGAVTRAHWHFGRAVDLATQASDSYGAAYAMRHAGMMLVDRGQPNNALKLTQLGTVRLGEVQARDERIRCARSECHVVSALALSQMDRAHQALDELKVGRDGWTPPNYHVQGCMDLDSAHTYLRIGQLDTAEAMATTSARTLTALGSWPLVFRATVLALACSPVAVALVLLVRR